MAMIIHRCLCGHPDLFHVNPRDPHSECSYTWCQGRDHGYGPPELIPAWDPASRPVWEIAKPGGRIHPYRVLCDCADCHALFRKLTQQP